MKFIVCKVKGQDAMIVGYAPVKRGKARAIVITNGVMKQVSLKDIELEDLPPELQSRVVALKVSNA